jgi:hypothetical protein
MSNSNGVITQADSLLVEFRATLTGSVLESTTAARAPSGTARLSKGGEWSLALPMAAYNPANMGVDRYVTVTAVTPTGGSPLNTVMFRGRIAKVEQEFTKGIRWVKLSGPDQLTSEWGEGEIAEEEIYDTVIETVAAVAREYWQAAGAPGNNASEFMPEANDGNPVTKAVLTLVDRVSSNFPEHLEDVVNEHIYLYVGHVAPFDEVHFDFDTGWAQEQVATLRMQQFLPVTEWTEITLAGNTTVVSGKPLAQDGIVSFAKSEKEIPLTHAKANLYWVRFSHSETGADLNSILIREIKVRTAGPATNDIQQVMTKCAPAGWTLHASSPTSTARKHQMAIVGETALRALTRLAERSGENFALTDTTQIRWMASPISSGVTAKEDVEGGDTSSSCYITNMRRVQERREIVTRVYLEGAGDDPDAAVNLSHLRAGTYTLPTGYAIAGNILAHTELEATLGKQILKRLKFRDIGALWGGTGGNPQSALELLKAGLAYLDIHKEHSEHFTATLTGINKSLAAFHPGMTMVAQSAVYDADGEVTEEIDAELVIVEVTRSMDLAGNLLYDVVLGKQAEYVPAAAYLEAVELLRSTDKNKHFQASSGLRLVLGGAVSTGGSGGGGGGGGGDGVDWVTFNEHVAETFDAHEIDTQIATHAALTTTAHGIPAQIDAKIATHTALPNAHHNQSHVLATTSALGGDHTVSGLTSGQVLKATGATAARFVQLQHSEIGGIGADDHHDQSHVLATASGLGADHTVSGLTAGRVLRATSATAASFSQLQHNEIGGIGEDDHHDRQHLLSSDYHHTVSGIDGDLVGNRNGFPEMIRPTADGHAFINGVLRVSGGFLKVRSFETHANAAIGEDLTVGDDAEIGDDLTVGGDVDVGGNTTTATLNSTGNADLYGSTVRVRNGRVGVNREPDTQFDGDVLGAFRAGYLVGPHALQIPDATMILNLDRALTGHRGQVPSSTSGAVLYQRGKHNEGLVAYPALTNLLKNPSIETDTTYFASDGTVSLTRSTDWSYRGEASLRWAYTSGSANMYYAEVVALDVSTSYTWSVVVKRFGGGAVSATHIRPLASWGTGHTGYVTDARYENLGGGAWRISQTFTTDASVSAIRVFALQVQAGYTSEVWFADCWGLVARSYAGPIFDGDSAGCAWTGTAHASSSTYTEPLLVYHALIPPGGRVDRSVSDTLTNFEGSIVVWLNMAAVTATGNRHVVYLRADGGGAAVALYISTTGKLVAENNGTTVTGATTITANTWFLASMDWGETEGVRVFLNGVLDASGTYAAPTVKQDPTFHFLSDPPSVLAGQPLVGTADMAVFASRQLEAIEHRAIYESNAPVFAYVSTVPSGGATTAGGRYSLDDDGLQFFNPAGDKTAHLKIAEDGEYLEVNGINILTPTDTDDPPPFNRLRYVDQDGNAIFQLFQDFFTTRLVNQSADWTQAGITLRAIPDNGTDDIELILFTQNGGGGWVKVSVVGGELLYADHELFKAANSGIKYENETLTYKNADGNAVTVGHADADNAWVTASLSNSWVDYGSSKSTAAYRLMPNGKVALKGVVKSGSSATAVIMTLPAGYRPAEIRRLAAAANSALGIVEITTGGAVSFVVGGSTTQSSLDGLEFWL